MEFKVYDQTIHYSDGIEEFAKYYSKFEEMKRNAINHIIKIVGFRDVTVNDVRAYLDDDAKKVAGDLVGKDIYDCTYSDLEKENDAFQKLDQVQEEMDAYISKVKRYTENQRAKLYDAAADNAAASVQGGPSFGILTSSIPTAMAYSAVGAMNANHQLNKAKRKFQESANSIDVETYNTRETLISNYKRDVLNESLVNIILDFYKILFTTYIFILEKNNKIKPVIQSLNEKRAYEMLESIDYVEDKKKLFAKSLEQYPFEYYIYYKAFELGLYNDDFTNILETLGVQTAIIENFKYSGYFKGPYKISKIETFEKASEKQNKFISLVSGIDQESILKDELSYYANELINEYKRVLNEIKKSINIDYSNSQYSILSLQTENDRFYKNVIIHIDNKNNGDLLKNKYGINIYASIFNDKEGSEISNREQALEYMKSLLDVRITKYKQYGEEIIKKREERKKANKKLQPVLEVVHPIFSFAKKHTVILIVILVILIVGINAIVAQANSNTKAQGNRNSEEIYNDGNKDNYSNDNDDYDEGSYSNDNDDYDEGSYSNDNDDYDEDNYSNENDNYYDEDEDDYSDENNDNYYDEDEDNYNDENDENYYDYNIVGKYYNDVYE